PTGPAAPSHTGNSSPVPVTPVHTGTEIKQVPSIVTTTYPADDLQDIWDFIYWQPDAAGTGVEPIYVMLSSPYGETNAKGEYSGRRFSS
ncbi:MAG: S-type pyocin domain-containing protein, partial [Plesiomonas sp.]